MESGNGNWHNAFLAIVCDGTDTPTGCPGMKLAYLDCASGISGDMTLGGAGRRRRGAGGLNAADPLAGAARLPAGGRGGARRTAFGRRR